MRIEHLEDHPEHVAELARLHHEEWGYLTPGVDASERAARLHRQREHSGIPTTFIALDGAVLCGSAMLVTHDMDIRPQYSPWLASVFVVPQYRNRGYGALLVKRAMAEASALGVPLLYLYTPDAQDFYARLGWDVVEHCEYFGTRMTVMSRAF